MVTDTQIRSKLQSKIFIPYGKSVTLKSKDSPTYNDRGEEEETSYTESSVLSVPYNIIDSRQSYEAFGTQSQGETDIAVPWDTAVSIDDLITIEAVDWRVKQIEVNYLPSNVASILRLAKVQP